MIFSQDDGQFSAQQTAASTLQQMEGFQEFRAEKGKKSFLDRQEGAVRVRWTETQGQEQPETAMYIPASSNVGPYHVSGSSGAGTKRGHAQMDDVDDFDPTQDGGFQTMAPDTTAADERRRKAPRTSTHHAQFTQVPQNSAEAANFGFPSSSNPNVGRKNPGSYIPDAISTAPNDPSLPKSSFYANAKLVARQHSVMASQAKPPQVRTPWSGEEENALIALIEEYGNDGISYAVLKKVDTDKLEEAELSRRGPEDMRFKARNMKVTMLM